MKKISVFLIILTIALNAIAQDVTLTFNGTGAATKVDSVIAFNQTTNQSVRVSGNLLYLKYVLTSIGNLVVSDNENISAYPNPFNSEANIIIPVENIGNIKITVVNAIGQVVVRSNQYVNAGVNYFVFIAREKGLYIAQIVTPGNSYQVSMLCNEGSAGPDKIRYSGIESSQLFKNRSKVKSMKDTLYLSYTPGDRILIKCKSDTMTTVKSEVPVKDSTYSVYFTPCTDGDRNHYSIVTIGTQTWMAENLKTTKFNDGTSIPLVTDSSAWAALTTPGFCYYENDEASYKVTYGALYNGYVVDSLSNGDKNTCPIGWHVPTNAEWITMENFLALNGYNYDGSIGRNGGGLLSKDVAKSLAATNNWAYFSGSGGIGNTDYPEKRNATGFTALPSGNRIYYKSFGYIGDDGFWWSSTANEDNLILLRSMAYNQAFILFGGYDWINGVSIRCVRD